MNNYNAKLNDACVEIKNKFSKIEIENALKELENDFDNPVSECARSIYDAMDSLYKEFENLHDDFCGVYIVFEDMSPILLG